MVCVSGSSIYIKCVSYCRSNPFNRQECKEQGSAHFVELIYDPQLTS